MKKWNRVGMMSMITAVCLLVTGAFYSPAPQSAWWCSTFSLICTEASTTNASMQESAEKNEIQFKWKIGELWRELFGKA